MKKTLTRCKYNKKNLNHRILSSTWKDEPDFVSRDDLSEIKQTRVLNRCNRKLLSTDHTSSENNSEQVPSEEPTKVVPSAVKEVNTYNWDKL